MEDVGTRTPAEEQEVTRGFIAWVLIFFGMFILVLPFRLKVTATILVAVVVAQIFTSELLRPRLLVVASNAYIVWYAIGKAANDLRC